LVAHLGAGGAYAREVRGRLHAFGQDLADRGEGAALRGAAGAEGHRAELRPQGIELPAGGAQLVAAFRRLGREEFKTQGKHQSLLRAWMKNSRLPSPPAI